MLEGQVAILSSGLLIGEESLALLESLRHSALYQADQHSYILYPDRDLPGFLEKNCLTRRAGAVGLSLLAALVEARDTIPHHPGCGRRLPLQRPHSATSKDVQPALWSTAQTQPRYARTGRSRR